MTQHAVTTPAVPRRSLRTNFVWQFFSNLATAAVQFSVGCLLAKLTTDDVTGQYQLGWTLSTPIFMFAMLDLRVFQATETKREFSFAEYLGARLVSGVVALFAALLFALHSDHSAETLTIVALVGGLKFVDLLADGFYGTMQKYERLDLVSRCSVIRATLQGTVFVSAIWLTRDLQQTLLTMLSTSIATLVVLEARCAQPLLVQSEAHAHWWRDRLSVPSLKRLIQTTMPLGFRLFLVSLIPNISRYFVSLFHGLATFGIYANISQVTTIAPLFSRSMNHAIAPRLAQLTEQHDATAFRRLLFKVRLMYAAFGAAAVIATLLFGKVLLTWLYRESYAEYHDVFVAVMIATAIQSVGGVLDMALVALRRTEWLAPVTALTMGAMTLASWILIPLVGLKGAAIAIAVTCIIREVLLQIAVNSALRDLAATPAEHANQRLAA